MILQQKSLKEFTLVGNTQGVTEVKISKFINGEFIRGSYLSNSVRDSIEVGYDEEITIIFAEDGIYQLEADKTYVIHNITNLLEIRQQFLTKALNEYKVDRCDHGGYYNYVTFCIVFDSYISLVEDTFNSGFATGIVPKTFLYKIDYLYNQLLKYKP